MLPLVFCPDYEVDFGDHVFPIVKYRLVRDEIVRLGICAPEDLHVPPPATDDELLRVHTPELLDDMTHCRWTANTWASELPLTPAITRAFRQMAGGTILAARLALEHGGAYHAGGGFHHAFAGHAEGFCYLNDVAVAVRVMQHEGAIERAVVIDCDLHQGNGTAHIFHGDSNVFTFSIHQENNYPVKQHSTLDIGLEDFAGDERYLGALAGVVPSVYDHHKPDLLVYVAGADPYEDDQLGSLRLTFDGLARRDRLVLETAAERSIPFVVVLAGGYARKTEDTVQIHVTTAQVAAQCLARRQSILSPEKSKS